MRDSQFQTPQKDQITANRRSKPTPDPNKKHRKSLNPSFAAISEEKVSEFSGETTEFCSPISETSENSVISPVDSAVTYAPETIVPSDQAPPSSSKSIITSDAASVALVPKCENLELASINNMLSVEAEMVIKHLSAARIQVLKSEVEYDSKKLLDVLLEAIIKEFHGGLCKERDLVDQLLSSKVSLIFVTFMLGVLAMFVSLLLRFAESGHPTRLTPT